MGAGREIVADVRAGRGGKGMVWAGVTLGRECRFGSGGDLSPPEPRLGMHVSIAGGMNKMAERARAFGCEAVQVFSRSPRGGEARLLTMEELGEARRILDAAHIGPVVVHVPYFMNLCADDDEIRACTVATLAGELERACLLGSPYVVTHLGRPPEGSGESWRDLVRTSVDAAFDRAGGAAGQVMLLLENTAGAGREVGSRLEELAEVLGDLNRRLPGRVGLCLDTCHAHAAGYDLSQPEGVAAFADRATTLFGACDVRVVHANDAVGLVGEHKDRHAPIGQGTVGEAGFRALMRHALFRDCPFLVETPGSDEERAKSLACLKRIRSGETRPEETEPARPARRERRTLVRIRG
jgi:deoxyribonuclease-4